MEVFTRPLSYHRSTNPDGSEYWAAREKGVDVLMALDISIGARSDFYDVAIVASADTDLLPALEDALEPLVDSVLFLPPVNRRRVQAKLRRDHGDRFAVVDLSDDHGPVLG